MNMSYRPTIRAQGGFTLIELIVVIVILGILAATAMPKFADLGGDARRSTVQAARGSLESVSAMVHGKALINGSDADVAMEGATVGVEDGYPKADAELIKAAGLTNTNDWTVISGAASGTSPGSTANKDVTIVPAGIATTSKAVSCYVRYTEPVVTAATGTDPRKVAAPVIEAVATSC